MTILNNKTKYSNKEIAKFIYNEAKYWFGEDVLINYTKKKMQQWGLTVKDLQDDKFEANLLFSSVLKQLQGIYDSVGDRYYSDEGHTDDVTQPGSYCKMVVDDMIENMKEYFGKDWHSLLKNKELVKKLS